VIIAELALAPIEFFRMHAAPTTSQSFVRHDRMEHFVIEDVFQIPARHERLIEQRVDSDDSIFFVNGLSADVSGGVPIRLCNYEAARESGAFSVDQKFLPDRSVRLPDEDLIVAASAAFDTQFCVLFSSPYQSPSWKEFKFNWVRISPQENGFFFRKMIVISSISVGYGSRHRRLP